MVDSHCHLYLPEFADDIDHVIKRAREKGISKVFFPAIDSTTHEKMLELEAAYPEFCFSMIGLHPCSVEQNPSNELEIVKQWLEKRQFAAIGEIGLDFHWDKSFVNSQYDAFHKQIELALSYNLPIVIHSRDATDECIAVVSEYPGKLKGIFHCFGGSRAQAEAIINCGFLLGIGGVVTYKNAGLAEVIKEIDLEHLVLETDSPYLTPVPFRGKRNESSYLEIIAGKIAEIKGIDIQTVERITDGNAEALFQMP